MSQREGGGGINTGVAQICVYFLGEGRGGQFKVRYLGNDQGDEYENNLGGGAYKQTS